MQEKIDDILGEPLVETEENKKMIRTPHGELPNYSVGERFGIGNGVRKKFKVLFGKKIFLSRFLPQRISVIETLIHINTD